MTARKDGHLSADSIMDSAASFYLAMCGFDSYLARQDFKLSSITVLLGLQFNEWRWEWT